MKSTVSITLALLIGAGVTFAQEQRVPGPDKSHLRGTTSVMTVVEMDGAGLTATDLVEAILGPGVSYSNVTFSGVTAGASPASAGTFTGGTGAGLGIEEGVMLSSGFVINAVGPNSSDGITGGLGTGSDADLDALVGGGTMDKTVLEFDFEPTANTVYIEYVFGSDEYNEFVNSAFNDVFAFFVNGTNIALIPSTVTPVAINNVNNGNPFGSACTNCSYYNNNDLSDGGPFFDNEMDGFTAKFTGSAIVTPNTTNHIKIAIADRGDTALDSWVYIQAESFSVENPDVPVSSWALFIGLGMILVFTLVRYRKYI